MDNIFLLVNCLVRGPNLITSEGKNDIIISKKNIFFLKHCCT